MSVILISPGPLPGGRTWIRLVLFARSFVMITLCRFAPAYLFFFVHVVIFRPSYRL